MAAAEQILKRSTWKQPRSNGDLSDREWEVMIGIAKGEAPSLIANRLGLSAKTIATYRARIIQKTGLKSNAEIAVAAYKAALID